VAAHFAAIEPSTEARERATTEARTTFEPHINVPAPPTTPAGAATFLLVVNAAGNIQRATLVRGNQPLAAIADALQGLHVQAPAPDDGDLDMPRVGTVQCESSGCSLTLSAAGTPVPNDPAAGGHGADVREMKRP
jgi:hypothetical protein